MEGIHNGVHGWVGGSDVRSAHRCFRPDLLGPPLGRSTGCGTCGSFPRSRNPPPASFYRALPPFPVTVRQTLDISTLGYEYAAQVIG